MCTKDLEIEMPKYKCDASAKTLVFTGFGAPYLDVDFYFSRATNARAHLSR